MYFFKFVPNIFSKSPRKAREPEGFINRHPVLKRARIKLNREMTECLFVLHLGESLVTSACGHLSQNCWRVFSWQEWWHACSGEPLWFLSTWDARFAPLHQSLFGFVSCCKSTTWPPWSIRAWAVGSWVLTLLPRPSLAVVPRWIGRWRVLALLCPASAWSSSLLQNPPGMCWPLSMEKGFNPR